MSLIKNEYTLTVDLKKPTTNIRPRFIQYDTAILYFKVYDNGKDFNFSEQTEIQVAHKKKSGKTEVGRASVITGNDGKPLIKYEYMGSEMNEVGNVTTSVSILSGKKKVTIQPFIVEMIKDIHSGIVDNVNKEYSLLQQLITTVESAVQGALDSAKLVKDAVDNANATLQSANELKESWKYLDVYDLTKSYKKNNVVSYNGSSFIALTDNTGKPPVGGINDLNWRLVAKKGTDGNGTVVLYSDTFQGKKGQTVFNLTHEYDQMQNRIHLIVGGAIQHSPLDFMETSSNKVTLNYPLEEDMRVVAVYFGEAPAITNDLQVQIDSIKEIVEVFNLVEIMNKGDYAKSQGDYAKQQGDIAKSSANDALLAKQATETATANANTESAKVATAISDLNQLKTTINTATTNANTATQNANNSASVATQTASNVQQVADNTTSAGTFVLGKSYKKNNLVLDNGSTWIALKDTLMNPLPVLPITENTYWRLVAQRGVDGTGSVASVNNIAPDVNGNIQLDMGDTIKMVDGFTPNEIGNVVTHENKAVLDALTDEAGQLKYNNKAVGSVTSVNGQTGDVTVQGFSGSYTDLTDKPTSFTPSVHTHTIAQVTGLQTELDNLEMAVHEDTFISTEGQTVFNLTGTYIPNRNWIKVEIGGVEQFSPENFTETSTTSFTLSEGLKAGKNVKATYYSSVSPITTDLESRVSVAENDISNLENSVADANTLATTHKTEKATATTLGHVMVDGETITVDSNGKISGANTYALPIANASNLGGIKPDGTTITVDAATGIASSTGGYRITNGSSLLNTASAWGEQSMNLDEITDTGIYYVNKTFGTLGTLPPMNTSFSVMVFSYRDAQNSTLQAVHQVAFASPSSSDVGVYMRGRFGTSWGSWIKVNLTLNDTLTSTSITEAATANAVKQVNDKLTGTSVILGTDASTTQNTYANISIGDRAIAGSNAVALGRETKALGQYFSVALGAYAEATGSVSLAVGYSSKSLNSNTGVLGTNAANGGVSVWQIPGSLSVTGTKNFEMPHPHPDKKGTHVIRHGAVESPTAGDTLYRYTIEAIADGQTVELKLPDYFQYLNKDVDVYVNADSHFAHAFGNVKGDILKVTCEKAGVYKALVIGTRNDDHESVQNWSIKGVEREIGESWNGETYVFEVEEITEVQEITEVAK